MVHLITGEKGKGKTRVLIDTANAHIKDAKGSVVYLDHSMRHMYELNNKIRLTNTKDYPLTNKDEVIGFFLGIISQNHDVEQLYIDGMMKLPGVEKEDIPYIIGKLQEISSTYSIDITITVSLDKSELDSELQQLVVTAL